MLPEMKIPPIYSWDQLAAVAGERVAERSGVRAAILTDADPDILRACSQATEKGLIEPIIVGDRSRLETTLTVARIQLTPAEIISSQDNRSPSVIAADLTDHGAIDLIVDGSAEGECMVSLISSGNGGFVPRGGVASHVAVLQPKRYKKLLLLSDGMVAPEPDIKGKIGIVGNIVGVAKAMGIDQPRIAVLAAVEVVYPQMPVTLEAAVLSKMAERRQIKGAYVDGPLSFDVAVDMDAAHGKGITSSEVAGQADAMLAPNIEVASGVYQALTLYGKCDCGGIIFGGRVPVAVNSRMDKIQDRLNSIILGVLAS